jgi:hypothetical protein
LRERRRELEEATGAEVKWKGRLIECSDECVQDECRVEALYHSGSENTNFISDLRGSCFSNGGNFSSIETQLKRAVLLRIKEQVLKFLGIQSSFTRNKDIVTKVWYDGLEIAE